MTGRSADQQAEQMTPMGTGTARSAGSSCISPSTIAPGSPTPRCYPTRKQPRLSASFAARSSFYRRHGIEIQELLTDNGGAYISLAHAVACRALGIRHIRTRPYRPQTNGKAERFIRTMLGGWAYGALYRNSAQRTAALDGWLWHYNHRRRHSALSHQTPIARLSERRTNVLGTYT